MVDQSRDSQVEACLDSFQYEKAARLCVHAVEQEPDSVRVLEEVGPVLLELGHADIALKVSCSDVLDCVMNVLTHTLVPSRPINL